MRTRPRDAARSPTRRSVCGRPSRRASPPSRAGPAAATSGSCAARVATHPPPSWRRLLPCLLLDGRGVHRIEAGVLPLPRGPAGGHLLRLRLVDPEVDPGQVVAPLPGPVDLVVT